MRLFGGFEHLALLLDDLTKILLQFSFNYLVTLYALRKSIR